LLVAKKKESPVPEIDLHTAVLTDNLEVISQHIKAVYDAIGKRLKPLGITFDYEHIKTTRPKIAKILQ
jgi:hypothetical protein